MEKEIYRQKQKIDSLFRKTSTIEDLELQADWAKYLCILVSGFVENSLKILIAQYSTNKSHKNITRYMNSQFKSITNLKEGKLKEILNAFSPDWAELFSERISEVQKNALDSVVSNRHRIAHGQNSDVSYANLEPWYKEIYRIIEFLNSDIFSL